ncbi:MAG TPA: methyltransferase [Streptosporangiales bacterium]
MPPEPDPDDVGEYLVSARSFDEYRAMFALTDHDLAGSVLDCPGGGSGFTARANEAGASAIAVDPVYARPHGVVAELVVAETARGRAHTGAGADRYVWDYFGDLDGYSRVRRASAEAFARDLVRHPARYLPAALPRLPFRGRAFDLVLSSHFLFTYADRLDLAFHRAALRELCRVARGQVRVFPLLEQGGRGFPAFLSELRATLGVPSRVERVDYEFQRGGNEMLVLDASTLPWS